MEEKNSINTLKLLILISYYFILFKTFLVKLFFSLLDIMHFLKLIDYFVGGAVLIRLYLRNNIIRFCGDIEFSSRV